MELEMILEYWKHILGKKADAICPLPICRNYRTKIFTSRFPFGLKPVIKSRSRLNIYIPIFRGQLTLCDCTLLIRKPNRRLWLLLFKILIGISWEWIRVLQELALAKKAQSRQPGTRSCREQALFYATSLLAVLAMAAGSSLLFLVPLYVDPAISTLASDFVTEPVTCITTRVDQLAGTVADYSIWLCWMVISSSRSC